eukprot:365203-Chlamydomonas_euryale.AAC.1
MTCAETFLYDPLVDWTKAKPGGLDSAEVRLLMCVRTWGVSPKIRQRPYRTREGEENSSRQMCACWRCV